MNPVHGFWERYYRESQATIAARRNRAAPEPVITRPCTTAGCEERIKRGRYCSACRSTLRDRVRIERRCEVCEAGIDSGRLCAPCGVKRDRLTVNQCHRDVTRRIREDRHACAKLELGPHPGPRPRPRIPCRLSPEGRKTFDYMADARGVIVGESRCGSCWWLMWEHGRVRRGYHKDFIELLTDAPAARKTEQAA